MGDVAVVEAPEHMDDGIRIPDVGKELVAQTFAPGRALDQTRDVDEFDHGGGEFLGVMLVAQPLEPLVRHGHNADVRVDGAERIVVRRNARICNCIK